MSNELQLDDTDIDNLYIVRFDAKNITTSQITAMVQDLKSEFPGAYFIVALEDMVLSVKRVRSDKKIIISEV